MKTNQEHFLYPSTADRAQNGNALIYVLIAIALFAALSFTLGRQTDTNEAGTLEEERAALYATQLISHAAQSKSAIDQMLFSGSKINDLDFTLPHDAAFDTGTVIHKVYHPQGGGLIPGTIPEDAISQSGTDPEAGWYLGRFNNVDWTATAGEDVILVAYQITEQICGMINEKINGSSTIPTITTELRHVFVDDSVHSGANVELTTVNPGDICPDCENMGSLCVQNTFQNAFSFYTIIADQ